MEDQAAENVTPHLESKPDFEEVSDEVEKVGSKMQWFSTALKQKIGK